MSPSSAVIRDFMIHPVIRTLYAPNQSVGRFWHISCKIQKQEEKIMESRASAPELGTKTKFLDEFDEKTSAAFFLLVRDVFRQPHYYGFISMEEASEVLQAYRSRIRSILERGLECNARQPAYLAICMRYLAKTYRREQQRQELREAVLESSWYSGFQFHDTAVKSMPTAIAENFPQEEFYQTIPPAVFFNPLKTEYRRILFLLLKCACELDDAMILEASVRMGVPYAWLLYLVHRARLIMEPQRLLKNQLQEKLNSTWVDLQILESRWMADEKSGKDVTRLSVRLEAVRKRYYRLLERRASMKLLLPNKEIAKILQVPKGSVDSGLYYFKIRGTIKTRLSTGKRENLAQA